MIRPQFSLDLNEELIVVLFAGAGGMCHAIERAFGRHVDIACNHNAVALAVHRINHPQTKHYICDVFELDPREATGGRPVGHLHLSPDCTHFSQAAEGQPRDEEIRSLSWVLRYWTGTVKPRIVTLENVKQMRKWGPLIAKRCKLTGRVIKRDKTVAAPGEIVPRREQFLVPDPKREGEYWRKLMRFIEVDGYRHDDNNLVAADYGAPTTRDRLFMVCRHERDPRPIIWPEITHAKKPVGALKKWRPAAQCVNWSLPVPSIFSRKRPLVDATCKRLARGIMDFVIMHPDPYIVDFQNGETGTPFRTDAAHGDGQPQGVKRRGAGAHDLREPIGSPARTNSFGLAVPLVVPICQTNGGNKVGSAGEPFPTMTAHPKGGHLALAAAFMAQHNGGNYADNHGHDIREPFSTMTGRATQQQLVTAHLAHLRNNCHGRDIREPVRTITAGGQHHALVECDLVPTLTPEQEEGALRCAAFLMRYYSHGGQWGDLRMPMPTATTRDRLALVTVWIQGIPRVIVDIGMRMFSARELYNGMGFSPSFIIERGLFQLPDGRLEERPITATMQKELCGNAVSPPPAEALLLANAPEFVCFGKGEKAAIA